MAMRDLLKEFVEWWAGILWRNNDADSLFNRWTVYINGVLIIFMSVIVLQNHLIFLIFSPFVTVLFCMFFIIFNGTQMGWYLNKQYEKYEKKKGCGIFRRKHQNLNESRWKQ